MSEGTRPSDAAKIFSSWTGRWWEDLLPQMHRMVERRIAKERQQRIHPMMTEYFFCSLRDNPSSNLLYVYCPGSIQLSYATCHGNNGTSWTSRIFLSAGTAGSRDIIVRVHRAEKIALLNTRNAFMQTRTDTVSRFHGSPCTNSRRFDSLTTSSECAINRRTCVLLTHRFLRRTRLQFFWRNSCNKYCPWTDTRQKYFTRIQPHVWNGKRLQGGISYVKVSSVFIIILKSYNYTVFSNRVPGHILQWGSGQFCT